MASAQVIPSSRKQELAEAGRRKLEQFRKQKAAERAKKASSNSGSQPVDGKLGQQRVTESDGTFKYMSNGPVELFAENHQVSSNEIHSISPFSRDGHDTSPANVVEIDRSKQRVQTADASGSWGAVDFSSGIETKNSSNDKVDSRPEVIPFSYIDKQTGRNYDSSSGKYGFHGLENSVVRENNSVPKVLPPLSGSTLLPSMSTQTGSFSYGGISASSSEDSLQHTTKTTGSTLEDVKNRNGSVEGKDSVEQKPIVSTSYLLSLEDNSTQPSESPGFDLDSGSYSALYSAKNETNARKSRPSFLDSLNISRASETNYQHSEVEKGSTTSGSSQLNDSGGPGSASLQYMSAKTDSNGPFTTMGASSNAFENFRSSLFPLANGPTLGFPLPNQNEDFAALEQHIEDLTQEKFSLQRALEASRALAESLASENSSLTETYNQQRGIVNQLKDDMAKLQEQIQAHMVELESIRMECSNAQLECNAADERAKILASEVISLEDKALRLRSNELKLARELENAQTEMASYKKKISSLEKDRQDLQSTINALQEEKKVLQTMLRRSASSGKSVDLGKSSTSRKDASTSTEDLVLDGTAENSHWEMHATGLSENDLSNATILPEYGQLALERLSIPSDQMRMIQNINTLLSELAMEKEELVQALSSELSQCSKLKELNKELSRKLESQTQRLELLTAQNMAVDNISSTKPPDSHVIQEITPFVDEGDEVVERVLGWIMKLFPGGPSKRRTSKLL